ncbi:MAG: alpha/beta hydrolase [Thermoleophilia bacterium]|nr:alpha/beta hydrolase [Thermoleophilia bacterium]
MPFTVPIRIRTSPLLLVAVVLLLVALLASLVPAPASAAGIRKVAVTRNITFTGTTTSPVQLDVWKPAGARGAPVLVLLHGGGWARSGRQEWDNNGWTGTFARAGYVIVNADYRLACNNGFTTVASLTDTDISTRALPVKADPALCNHTMADALDDANAAVGWAATNARRYGGDPHRIVLMGGSAGAHLALLVASEPNSPRSIRGVVAFSPPADIEWLNTYKRKLSEAVAAAIGCDFTTCPDQWRPYNPFRQVLAGASPVPTYIMRSRLDSVTPFGQVRTFATAALRAGVPLTLHEPKNKMSTCHGPWSCERQGVAGTTRSLRLDVITWIRVRVLGGVGTY